MEAIVSGMATQKGKPPADIVRIRKGAKPHVYIKEWMEHLNVSDDEMAGRLGLASRSAVWKRYREQHRLDPGKIQQFADALGIQRSQLNYPPGMPSLDAIADEQGLDGAARERLADVVRLWMERAS